ncbi:MAG: S-layer homology domain-containing protein [Oscillospiraceae bacterium]|nr:S-layer homology domain-containing protein [Oscillospiraceae bacterium]
MTATMPFADVEPGSWYYDAVLFAYINNLMNGMDEDTFGPGMFVNRSMTNTVLYRLEGSPAVSGENFPDVKSDAYFFAATLWAKLNGILKGHEDGLFHGEWNINREQLVTILYRYAQMKGYDTGHDINLSQYADAKDINDFAQEAMRWAVYHGLIRGRTTTELAPQGTTSRAELAMILMRFCQMIDYQLPDDAG